MWYLSSLTRDRTHVPCIGRQILNHYATREALFWIFWGTAMLLSIAAAPFYMPTISAHFSIPSPTLVIFCFLFCFVFYSSHPKGCEVLDLHFPKWLMMLSIFSCDVGHLYIFFGDTSIQVLFQFFNPVVSFLLLNQWIFNGWNFKLCGKWSETIEKIRAVCGEEDWRESSDQDLLFLSGFSALQAVPAFLCSSPEPKC